MSTPDFCLSLSLPLRRYPELFFIALYKVGNTFITNLSADLRNIFGAVSQQKICVIKPFVLDPQRRRCPEFRLEIALESRKAPARQPRKLVQGQGLEIIAVHQELEIGFLSLIKAVQNPGKLPGGVQLEQVQQQLLEFEA